METSYAGASSYTNLEQKEDHRVRYLIIILAVVCALLLGLLIFTIWYAVENPMSSADSKKYCTTPTCLELADNIANSLNTSVDPCDDFYHYTCDNWDAANSWQLFEYSVYVPFQTVSENEMHVFMDAIYDNNEDMMQYSSVNKAFAYLATCYDSIVSTESFESDEFLQELLEIMSFTESVNDTWDESTIDGFQSALVYLQQRDYVNLFTLSMGDTMTPFMMQYYQFWLTYDSYNISAVYHRTFVPLFMNIFNFTFIEANQSVNDVLSFMDSVYSISTVTDDYWDPSLLFAMVTVTTFSNFTENIIENGQALNYSKFIYDVYQISDFCAAYNATMPLEQCPFANPNIYYVAPNGPLFFNSLAQLVDDTPPITMQLFLMTQVLWWYLDFEESMQQSRYISRREFCFEATLRQMPFVYGYVLSQKMYDEEKYVMAQTLTEHIKENGVKASLKQSKWMDEASKSAALDKIENMQLYVGFPPPIKNGDSVDSYYMYLNQSIFISWTQNIQLANEFTLQQSIFSYYGANVDLFGEWPSDLQSSAYYDYWLTGINAFYVPEGNWFIIPITITQKQFFDVEYPSAVNFGSLGGVCGHEMSHGFDPYGTQYDWEGNYVGSIFSNATRAMYDERMQCFVDQYSAIVIDYDENGHPMFDNGTQTITENVADNAGLTAAWLAWKAYVKKNGQDKLLYGLDLTQEQLFWVGWANNWCGAHVEGAFEGYTDEHSPGYARVMGPLQNSKHFADAFKCTKKSRMVSKNPCILW